MLHLASKTEADWGRRALPGLDEILLEQAHLEKKAASAALNYLFRYPDRPSLQRPLSELAREELTHFELILAELERREVPFRPQKASPYAARLLAVARGAEPARLLDCLLCSAMIEARSCERMRLLGEAVAAEDPRLGALYRDLVASEARHHGLYVNLARGIFPRAEVDARLAEIARHEAAVVAGLSPQARLHA